MDITRRRFLQGALAVPVLLNGVCLDKLAATKENNQADITNPLKDQRLSDLLKLVQRVSDKRPIDLREYPSHNVYLLEHVVKDSSIEKVEDYFEQRATDICSGARNRSKMLFEYPLVYDESTGLIICKTTVEVQYLREFDDGVVQVAGFGLEWESEPNTCWALYGHAVCAKGEDE